MSEPPVPATIAPQGGDRPHGLRAWLSRHRPGEVVAGVIGASLLVGVSLLPGGLGCVCGGSLNPAAAALVGAILGVNLLAAPRAPAPPRPTAGPAR